MACRTIRVPAHHVPAKRTGRHKHKAYKVKGYSYKRCGLKSKR